MLKILSVLNHLPTPQIPSKSIAGAVPTREGEIVVLE